ncbi:MAG: DUF5665 domain-containing protein [Bacillota bacterium]
MIKGQSMSSEQFHERLEDLARYLEKSRVAEYVEILGNPKRLLLLNFIAGMARGLGYAIGLTFLAALILFILSKIVMLNLPLVSDFIANIVRMVQQQM